MPIDYEKRDGVAYITLNNPGKANILDKSTSDDISAAWIDLWEDRGFWLIILLIPLLLASFRKGAVFVLVLGPMFLSPSPTHASIWQDLWYTADQQGQNALQKGDAASAQLLFKNPQWQASAAYKNNDFETAAKYFKLGNSADNYYNLGNAMAKMGELDKAIDAYNQALNIEPDMQDAIANRELIEQLKKQQQDQSKSGDKQDQDDKSQDSQSQDSQSQESQSQDSQQQNSSEENQAQENQQQTEDEQQQAEEKIAEDKDSAEQELSEMQKSQQQELEEQQELQQWLRRVPDDPGGLLRQKFRYQSQQRASEQRRPPPPNQQERW